MNKNARTWEGKGDIAGGRAAFNCGVRKWWLAMVGGYSNAFFDHNADQYQEVVFPFHLAAAVF